MRPAPTVIKETGVWHCPKESHHFDEALATGIAIYLKHSGAQTAYDFGCGSGAYVTKLCQHGIETIGFDGNPDTMEFADHCYKQELHLPFQLALQADAVISLEVGEHIPEKFEANFISNLDRHAKTHLIVSWFPTKGHGIGHVNEKPNQYVVDQFRALGWLFEYQHTETLRTVATEWWFKESLMVFRRT